MEHRVARVVEGDAVAQLPVGPGHAHTGDGGQVGQHAADQEVGRRGARVGVERDGDVPDEVHGRWSLRYPTGRTLTISTANARRGPS